MFDRWASNVSQQVSDWGLVVAAGCSIRQLTEQEMYAYEAPFPTEEYKAAPRVMPHIVPASENHFSVNENIGAWKRLERWEKPFLCLFSNRDRMMKGLDKIFIAKVPGTKGQNHYTIEGGNHFLQEDCGPVIAEKLIEFISANPLENNIRSKL